MPYDPFSGPTGTYSTNAILRPVQPLGAPYDAMSSPSGPLPTTGYDAFGSPSGPQPGTGPQRHDDFGGPSGPHRYDDFGGPSGPQPTAPPGFDAFGSTSGPQQAAPAFDAFTGPSGPHPGTGAGPRRAPGQDAAFGGPSGPHRFDAFGGPSGPQPAAAPGFDAFGSASGPQTQPRMGGTTPGTTAPTGPGATGAPPTGPGATGAPPAGRINSGAFEAIRAARANRDPGFPVGGDTRQADPGTRSGGTGGRGDGPGARTGGARRTGTTGEIPRVGARGRAAAEEGRARGAARRDEGRARGGGRGDFGRPPRRRPDGGTWFRHGRPTPRLLLAAAGTAGAVLLAVLLLRAGGSGEEPARFTSSAAPTAQTSQTSQQPVSGTGEVPEGYKARTQIGVTVTVPEDWKVSATDTKATFSDPDGGQQTITVEKAPSASDGGLATLGEEREKSELAEYIQVQLQPVTWGSWRAADWEYTHTLSNGVPAHTLTRFVTVDAERAYKITFSAPDLKWDEGAEIRETFFAGFTPA
ncbi:hypothetical protein [Thermocatellispora tengchongensis]|uniref:hypothetical protein n=1 Tax=Thermocatellispora tengchongensis TaxID=1073253 RepID=UPI00362BE295